MIWWILAAGCFLLALWPYVGYPLLWALVAKFWAPGSSGTGSTSSTTGSISVVLPARNEQDEIGAMLEHLLALGFPEDTEWIVVSDASEDRTDAIVSTFAPRGVRLLRVEGHRGKTACQQAGIAAATGDVVLLTDCGARLEADAWKHLVAPFADPHVGCTGGRAVYGMGEREPSPFGTAWKRIWDFEHVLRSLESRVAGLTGVTGFLCALRRDKAPTLRDDLLDDWTLAPYTVAAGLRCAYVPEAVARKGASRSILEDARRRLRIGAQTLHTLWATRRVWGRDCGPLFAIQVVSHKLLRYLAPACMLIGLIALAMAAAYESDPAGQTALALLLVAAVLAALCVVGLAVGLIGVRTPLLWPLGYGLFLQGILLLSWFRWWVSGPPTGWQPTRDAPDSGTTNTPGLR